MEIILNLLAVIGLFFVGVFMGGYLRRLQMDKYWTIVDEIQWWWEYLRL